LMYQFSALLSDPYIRLYADSMNAGAGTGPLGFVLAGKAPPAKNPSGLPANRHFPGVGLVSLHTNLGDAEKDIHFLFHSDPYGPVSHAHADENAFTIEAFGEALAIKSGYYPWYGSEHHTQWSWQTKSSNCITVNGGKGQRPHDPYAKGRILAFETSDSYDYVAGDATEAYRGLLSNFRRHVIHVRPGIFVIFDDLASGEEVTYEWWLHALSEMSLDEKEQRVTVSQGDARLRVQFLEPGGLVFHQTDQFSEPPEWGEKNQWHFFASTPEKVQETKFLTVLTVYRRGEEEKLGQLTYLSGDGAIGVRIATGSGECHLVGFRTREGGTVSLAGFETDGPMLARPLPKEVRR
jgi:hypothetical protein